MQVRMDRLPDELLAKLNTHPVGTSNEV
jgi:hypothetical protein